MKTQKHLTPEQTKVRDSVYNGWYMSGKYRAVLGQDAKEFEADSSSILTKDVAKWFFDHDEQRNDEHLLVKCVEVF